jgi:hypothetical protein
MVYNTQQFVYCIYCHSLYQRQQSCVLLRLEVGIEEAEVWTDVNEVTVRWAPLLMSVIQGWCLECKAPTISMNYWVRYAALCNIY